MKRLSKWLVVFVCIIFCCMGCRKTPMQMITNNNSKYWVQSFIFWIEDIKMRGATFYYYDVNGNFKMFIDGYKREYGLDNGFFRGNWRLLNDSAMEENGKVYRIVKLTPDIMIRKSVDFGSYDTLYAIPDNKIPKEFRRRW